MKNIRVGLMATTVLAAGLFAFTTFQSGSIKGKVSPPEGASQVWALSATDTLKAVINQGSFEFQNVSAGTYKVYIDAVQPYKDVVKEGVQVTDGGAADLGEIMLQK
jgi:hypothetical protein